MSIQSWSDEPHRFAAELNALLDLDAVLKLVSDEAARLLNASGATVLLYDENRDELHQAASVGVPSEFAREMRPIARAVFEKELGQAAAPTEPLDPAARSGPVARRLPAAANIRSGLTATMTHDGRLVGAVSVFVMGPGGQLGERDRTLLQHLADLAAPAVVRARRYAVAHLRASQFAALYEATRDSPPAPDLATLLRSVAERAASLLRAPAAAVYLYDAQGSDLHLAAGHGATPPLGSRVQLGEGMAGHVARTRQPLLVDADHPWDQRTPHAEDWPYTTVVEVPMLYGGELIGVLAAVLAGTPASGAAESYVPLLTLYAGQAAGAVHSARLFAAEQARRWELALLHDLARGLAEAAPDLDQTVGVVVRHAVRIAHVTFARLALVEGEELVVRAAYPIRALASDLQTGYRAPLAALPLCQAALDQKAPVIIRAASDAVEASEHAALLLRLAKTMCLLPMSAGGQALGLLILGEARREEREAFTADKMRLVASIGDQAASAMHLAMLHERTERQLQRLVTLRTIDQAITASLDLRHTLQVLLAQVTAQLHVDAADILLLNHDNQMLEFAAGHGFVTTAIPQIGQPVGQGLAGRAALERRIVHSLSLPAGSAATLRTGALIAEESFVAYYGVPLLATGQLRGVLEIFHRSPIRPDPDWLEFLQTLAEHAAGAISNAELFESVQRSSLSLLEGLDAALEGWVKAVDLRTREVEGHAQRVADMTVFLGRAMAMSDEELLHARRGALLHDIGKMGIPDGILLKPGALTEDEWALVRRHPSLAYEMLSPITYLQPALDIPYCHHEKWDGTGYPRGLQGEQIPLAARIFAVADVWDVLRSERPYRPAWPDDKARAYIHEQAGEHFDRRIVDVFSRGEF